MPITREAAVEQYGPTLDMDDAIAIAGAHARELDDLIDAGLAVDVEPRWTDGGAGMARSFVQTDDLFNALET